MGSSRLNSRDVLDWDESDVRVRPNKRGSRPRTKDRPAHKSAIRGRVITVDRGRWSVVVAEGTVNERTLARPGPVNYAAPQLSPAISWMWWVIPPARKILSPAS